MTLDFELLICWIYGCLISAVLDFWMVMILICKCWMLRFLHSRYMDVMIYGLGPSGVGISGFGASEFSGLWKYSAPNCLFFDFWIAGFVMSGFGVSGEPGMEGVWQD